MRKYGRWMLALGIIAVAPAVSNAQFVGQRAAAGRYAAAPPSAAQYNQQMAEQIAGALRKAQLRGYDVEIEFKDGIAVLKGKVKDSANKMRASQAVQALTGIKRVDNQLKVLEQQQVAPRMAKPMMQPGQQPVRSAAYEGQKGMTQQVQPVAAMARSNQQVADSVAKALSGAGLQGCDVEIRVQNGTAILGGSVFTPVQRATAERVASGVMGVKAVSNQLGVSNKVPTRTASFAQQIASAPTPGVPMGPQGAPMMNQPVPMMAANPMMGGGGGGGAMYGSPNLPDYAWPSYAQYPNSAAVTYPTQYSASAWPYIGPYYPYPQVPLGWRKAQLEWDDGHWQLSFNNKTDKWFWFMLPKNW